MLETISPINLADVVEVGAVLVSGLLLTLGGRTVLGGRGAPEVQLVSGWGAYCLLTTLWGVVTPASLAIPTTAFLGLALSALCLPGLRPRYEDWTGLARVTVLSAPLWVVMTGVRPSQSDTFTNILPNATYLFYHGFFPTDARPPSHSELPATPYNLQLAAYLPSLLVGRFIPGAASLFSIVLHLAAGLLFARILHARLELTGAAPPWWACALGLLFATLLNPGFVPRYSFSSYSEGAMAVAAVVAAWLSLQILADLRTVKPASPNSLALALTLAAMVNLKQMSIGLVVCIVAALGILMLLDRRIKRANATGNLLLVVTLPLALYLVWRGFVLSNFSAGELKPLPISEWHWNLLPQILEAIAEVIALKGILYGTFGGASLVFLIRLREHGLDLPNQALLLATLLFVTYSAVIIGAYICIFPPQWSLEAHSYYRWSAHLALVPILAFILLACERRGTRRRWSAVLAKVGAPAAIMVVLAAPMAFSERLRFDRTMPQPLVWGLADIVAQHLAGGDLIALILPGDNGSVSLMLETAIRLRSEPNGKPRFVLPRAAPNALPEALEEAAAIGASLVVVSCVPPDARELPTGSAALLGRTGEGGWMPIEIQHYPPFIAEAWRPNLSFGPFCQKET